MAGSLARLPFFYIVPDAYKTDVTPLNLREEVAWIHTCASGLYADSAGGCKSSIALPVSMSNGTDMCWWTIFERPSRLRNPSVDRNQLAGDVQSR
jgi:hypothetical protein